MIVCPICEHAQDQGAECEVCGKRLVPGLSAADRAIPAVEGLEPTRFMPADALEERMPDLEPTLRSMEGVVVEERTPDLEATAAAPVDVEVSPTPDVERMADGIPEDAPTLLPSVVVCRYCRTPAAPGDRLCARCGVRLPVVIATPAESAESAQRLCSCGATVRQDAARCPTCGARLR